VTSTGAL
jgi:dihydrolipoamide dehydrogenase